MKLAPVDGALTGSALAHAVEKIPNDLIGHKQAKQIQITVPGKNPEQSGTVSIHPLAVKRAERIFPNRLIWN